MEGEGIKFRLFITVPDNSTPNRLAVAEFYSKSCIDIAKASGYVVFSYYTETLSIQEYKLVGEGKLLAEMKKN